MIKPKTLTRRQIYRQKDEGGCGLEEGWIRNGKKSNKYIPMAEPNLCDISQAVAAVGLNPSAVFIPVSFIKDLPHGIGQIMEQHRL